MDGLNNIILSVLPPFLLLGLGAFARKVGWFRAEADASLSMITIRVLYPCFILYHILGAPNMALDFRSFLTPLYGFFSILIGFFLSWAVSHIFKMERDTAKSFRFCSGIFNYGFIAIPVGEALFGTEIVVRIILFNLGVEVAIWTIGIVVLTSNKFSISGMLNPPSVAVLIALFVQVLGGKELLPSFVWEVVMQVGRCSIPIGLILIGGSFYVLMEGFKFSKGLKIEGASILVRNFLFPSIVLAFVYFFPMPGGMEWMKPVLVTQAAMPAGIFAIVIVGNYKGDKETAMRSILVTMIASIITLPIWLMIGVNL